MSFERDKQAKLANAKSLFGKAINNIGINDSHDQLTTLTLMLLKMYESISSVIDLDLSEEEKGHIERAKQFREIKGKSKLTKDKIRAAKDNNELNAISLEEWR